YHTSGIDNIEAEDFLTVNTKNIGFAVDLGATYQFSEKLSFSASLIDLGYINWNNNPENFKINDFNFTYTGVDLVDFINGGSNTLQELQDTLETQFETYKTENSYNTGLYTRFFIGANYEINDKINFGALIF